MTPAEIENLKNHADSWRVDSLQLERMSRAISAAMPHFRSAMGAECDHAEPAVEQLIVERNTLREALKAVVEIAASGTVMVHETGKPTWTVTKGITQIAKTALASLYDPQPEATP